MDFVERLKEHMEGLSFTPSVIQIGAHNKDGDSIAIRPSPSNIDTRDMGHGKIYPFSFQVLVHNKNNHLGYTNTMKLMTEYDMPTGINIVSDDGTFVLISIRNTTTPNHVEETSYGTLWTAVFEAELYIN